MKRKIDMLVVLALALALALMGLTVAVTGSATDGQKPELTPSFKRGISPANIPTSPSPKPKQTIIWDNGGTTANSNLYSSQNDTCYPFVSQVADDFIFDQDMRVTDVHWWGGFWNVPPDSVDPCYFYIYFYADDGTGNAPTGGGMPDPAPTALATYHFSGISGLPLDPNGFYEYDVDLNPPFIASANTKYWIAIQEDTCYPPQWGWANTGSIQLHSAVQGFPVLGVPFWTDIVDPAVDMAYYLTGEPGEPWPNHKMHFPQEPDLEGWDVYAVFPKTLADDWQCSQTGWVTDIHFWGSWKDVDGNPYTDDYLTPMPWFVLSIHENIPADPDTPWSRPGRILWQWEGEIPGTPNEPPAMEHWYNPNTGEWLCNDHVPYWRYDFFVEQASPPADSFFQYEDSIYWLNISAVGIDSPYAWGWKSSRDHFMDDAVYTDNPPEGPWVEMFEPPRCNWFDVYFDEQGNPQEMGSTNYYGNGWYRYEYWWNMWFYDNPFTYERPKHIWMDFFIEEAGPGAYAEFAINWSTPEWDTLGMGRPPMPGEPEELYIGREIFPVTPGPNTINYVIPYNPEWISIDFVAFDVLINGWIWHECEGTSLDLAFVITGHEGEPPVTCGDVNNDGVVDLGDIVYLISYVFRGGPPPVPMTCVGDVNNDDIVNVGDVVYLISYVFRAGPAPNPNCCNPPWASE